MYEAENILCEWDWDWNWDLGDGYSTQQLEVLTEVRKTIREGIKAYESDPEAIRKHKEEQELKKLRRQRIEEFACRIPYQQPDRPLTESDPFWQELRERQCLTSVSPLQLMRIIASSTQTTHSRFRMATPSSLAKINNPCFAAIHAAEHIFFTQFGPKTGNWTVT